MDIDDGSAPAATDRHHALPSLGRRGETAAARLLEARGWTVLARNYRAGREEVDLIVERAGVLAFVEVKTRSTSRAPRVTGLEAIDARKQARIRRVAAAWLRENRFLGHTVRFDAVVVRRDAEGELAVEHIADAWW